jgi:outer membrane cobalamin receptor
METIGSIEIIKGPNSTSFGSGLGGVINLFAREIPWMNSRLSQPRPMEVSDFETKFFWELW